MDTSLLLPLACIAGLAGFTQGFAGFGSTLVAMPLLVSLVGMHMAVPLGCMMALSINIMLIAKLYRQIQFKSVRLLLSGALPGIAVGALTLRDAPEGILKALLGVSILALALLQMRGAQPTRPPAKGWGALAGLVAGGMVVSIGVDGPPIVAWVARQPWGRDTVRATLTFYFLVAGFCVVLVKTAQGLVTPESVILYAGSMPALVAGLMAGALCCGRAGDAVFRRVLLLLLAGSGLMMLWQGGIGLAGMS
jgi:uncharacterized protein